MLILVHIIVTGDNMSLYKNARTEQKQHINISNHALGTIENDSLTFSGQRNISGFINRIVLNCSADIEKIMKEYSISSVPIPKETSRKIRLQNNLYDILYSEDFDSVAIKYKTNQGDYIRNIIENYARLSFFGRESIYFKNELQFINDQLLFTEKRKRVIKIRMLDGKKYYFKVFRISDEYEASYHYLIGYSKIEASDKFIPASFRLSRIADMRECAESFGSGKITAKESALLNDRIKKNGVSYILGTTERIEVKLTQTGMNMYNNIFHLRPLYQNVRDNQDNSFSLFFETTTRQINDYFFLFGREAEIISPKELRDSFADRYKLAYQAYSKRSLESDDKE